MSVWGDAYRSQSRVKFWIGGEFYLKNGMVGNSKRSEWIAFYFLWWIWMGLSKVVHEHVSKALTNLRDIMSLYRAVLWDFEGFQISNFSKKKSTYNGILLNLVHKKSHKGRFREIWVHKRSQRGLFKKFRSEEGALQGQFRLEKIS